MMVTPRVRALALVGLLALAGLLWAQPPAAPLPDKGVFVTLVTPDGRPVVAGVRDALYARFISVEHPRLLPDGRLWLDQRAGQGAEVKLTVFRGAGGQEKTRLETKLPGPGPRADLTMEVPTLVRASVRVLDSAGQPLRDAALPVAVLTFPDDVKLWRYRLGEQLGHDDYFLGDHMMNVRPARTDGDGVLALGEFRPGERCTLTMESADALGTPMGFAVADDGAVNPPVYRLAIPRRDVAQVVFGEDGRPAVNRRVHLTCSWHERITMQTATTDAAGRVTWRGVPPVAATVWGEGVPAAVLPREGTTFDAPLAAPEPGRVWLQALLPVRDLRQYTDPQFATLGLDLEYCGMSGYSVSSRPRTGDDPPDPGVGRVFINTGAYTGRPVNAIVWYGLRPSRASGIVGFRMSPTGGEFTPPFAPDTTVRLRFALADGTPVPRVSRLRVVPAEDGDLARLFADPFAEKDELLTPAPAGDGSYVVHPPAPGVYRVVVDLMHRHAPAPPALCFTVREGEQAVTITLPEPLLTAPAGAEVHYLTFDAPAEPRTLVTPLDGPAPIFADPAAVLACWCRTAPDTLLLWKDGGPARTLKLRAVELNGRPVEPEVTDRRLEPLLPGLAGPTPAGAHTKAEDTPVPFDIGPPARVYLWPGQYLATATDQDARVELSVVPVPADGPAAITAPMWYTRYRPVPARPRLPEAAAVVKDYVVERDDGPEACIALDRRGRDKAPPVWWLPDEGAPGRLPVRDEGDGVCRVGNGPGWAWILLDPDRGVGIAERTWPTGPWGEGPGEHEMIEVGATPRGPSLGIILPFDPKSPVPGAIGLTGLDAREGVVMHIPAPRWTRCPELGITAAQIAGIPPGTYRVSVVVGDKIVKGEATVTETGGSVRLE